MLILVAELGKTLCVVRTTTSNESMLFFPDDLIPRSSETDVMNCRRTRSRR